MSYAVMLYTKQIFSSTKLNAQLFITRPLRKLYISRIILLCLFVSIKKYFEAHN